MPNNITSDNPSRSYVHYKLNGGERANVASHPSRESIIGLTTDVSSSQNTMTQQTNKRAHSPTPENSKNSKSTPALRNNLLLLADAAVEVERHNTDGEPNLQIRPTPKNRTFLMENLRRKIMNKNVNTKVLPTSETPLRTTQEERSTILIREINKLVSEVTDRTYMINNGNGNYSQELIEFEERLFEKIYGQFRANKRCGYPLDDKEVWEKIKLDLIADYKNRGNQLIMWNAEPYQQRTDDAQNITLKNVDVVKKELIFYLRQQLGFLTDLLDSK